MFKLEYESARKMKVSEIDYAILTHEYADQQFFIDVVREDALPKFLKRLDDEFH